MNTNRALVAARLSRTVKGGEGRSRIERDDESAQKWAEANGRVIVAVSEDAGVSGGTDPFKRPGLGKFLTDPVKRAQYDEIVASTLDRLGRNARDLAELRNWAEDHEKIITILSPNLHWPPAPDDFASPIIWDVLARVAEMELRIITKRYADQRRDLTERGALVGKPPFGFVVQGERGNKTIIPNPALLPVMLEMVQRAKSGDTLLSICQWLDRMNVRPAQADRPTRRQNASALTDPTKWHPKVLSQWLRNPALKGRRLDAKGRVVMKHEGILSVEDWNALQAVLDSKKTRGATVNPTAFLTGAITCRLCGGPMFLIRNPTTRGVRCYYRCKGSGQVPSTCKNLAPQSELEDFVNTYLTTGNYGKTEIVTTVVVPGDDYSAEIAEVEDELRTLDFDDPSFNSKQERLLADRARLRALPAGRATIETHSTGKVVGDVWPDLSDVAKREFLLSAGIRITVRPLKAGEEYPDNIISEADEGISVKMAVEVDGEPSYFGLAKTSKHIYWISDNPPAITAEALRHILDGA